MENKLIKIFENLEPTALEYNDILEYDSNIFYHEHLKALDMIKKLITRDSKKHYEKNNIILIDGERGSGKTSSLLTIKNFIKNIDKVGNYKDYQDLSKVYVIDKLIDPSMFSNNDNILQLIIANMFKEIKTDNNLDVQSTEILDYFEKIVKLLSYNISEFNDSVDVMNTLNNCSNYYDAKDVFRDLVQKFLKYKSNDNRNYSDICIFIDDIDLNIENSFIMFEQIRKYLKQDNIIIVMGIKLESLNNVLTKKYYLDYKPLLEAKDNALDSKKLNLINIYDMSNDYITKVLPSNFRIKLPNKEQLSNKYRSVFLNLCKEQLLFDLPTDNKVFFNKFIYKSLRENNQFYVSIRNNPKTIIDDDCIVFAKDMVDTLGISQFFEDFPIDEEYKYKINKNKIMTDLKDIISNNHNSRENLIYLNLLLGWYKQFSEFDQLYELFNELDITLIFNNSDGEIGCEFKNSKLYFNDIFDFNDDVTFNDKYYYLLEINEKRSKITKDKNEKTGIENFISYIKNLPNQKYINIKNKDLYDKFCEIDTKKLSINNFNEYDNYSYILSKLNALLNKSRLTVREYRELVKFIETTQYKDIINHPEINRIESLYKEKYDKARDAGNTTAQFNARQEKLFTLVKTLKKLLIANKNR